MWLSPLTVDEARNAEEAVIAHFGIENELRNRDGHRISPWVAIGSPRGFVLSGLHRRHLAVRGACSAGLKNPEEVMEILERSM